MKFFKSVLPWLILQLLAFYLLPTLIRDTGSAMMVLLTILPLICVVSGLLFGARHGFHILYPVLVAVLFAPSIPIFYNASASIYIGLYGLLALAGSGIGGLLHWWREKSGKMQ